MLFRYTQQDVCELPAHFCSECCLYLAGLGYINGYSSQALCAAVMLEQGCIGLQLYWLLTARPTKHDVTMIGSLCFRPDQAGSLMPHYLIPVGRARW